MTDRDSKDTFEQRNAPHDGGTVYSQQGGTQNNTGGDQYNGDRYEYDSNGGPQHNGFGDQNVTNVTQTLPDVDHILNGGKALEQRMYPEVISEFNAYLSTASKDEDQSGVETCTKVAQAHAYIALAMLDGSPASYRSPEEIERVQRRLNESLRAGQRAGGGVQVVAWASVLWQIVCEDYYKADGMNPPMLAALKGGRPPSADSAEHIARLIADLDDLSVTLLISHVARSRGDTWRALEARAQPLNLVDPDDDENPEPAAADPTRAERVRKYFTQTPDKVENTRAIVGACATAALILLGIIVGGFTLVLFFVGAVASGRWTYHRLREYQQYLKDFAAAEPKPSDQEMDAWLVEDMEYIRRRAANRLRLNAKLKSEGKGGDLVFPAQIVVGVWEFDGSSNLGANGSALTHTQHGSDGKMRADYYKVLILFLTDKLISTFGGLLDFKTGDLLVDWAREFHYRDIVEVSSISEPMSSQLEKVLQFGGEHNSVSHRQVFRLTLMAGSPLEVTTGYTGPTATDEGEVAWSQNAFALPIVQRMVRARHNTAPTG